MLTFNFGVTHRSETYRITCSFGDMIILGIFQYTLFFYEKMTYNQFKIY
jgi:hypothetical protein